MQRYKLLLQYDGSNFRGWQSQKDDRTIQGEMERALSVLNHGKRVTVVGAGRTDSGVHATGQVAHFDLDTRLSESDLLKAINGNLPADIRVDDCSATAMDFHARFSAVKRIYQYKCRTDEYLLDRHYSWLVGKLDIDRMSKAAGMIIGEHDFTSFCKINPELEHNNCLIYHSSWNLKGPIVNYKVIANRFLHHMVRYLVGTMVAIGRHQTGLKQFEEMILNPGKEHKIYRAPANGLILKEVFY